jgi:hypothetical protein
MHVCASSFRLLYRVHIVLCTNGISVYVSARFFAHTPVGGATVLSHHVCHLSLLCVIVSSLFIAHTSQPASNWHPCGVCREGDVDSIQSFYILTRSQQLIPTTDNNTGPFVGGKSLKAAAS